MYSDIDIFILYEGELRYLHVDSGGYKKDDFACFWFGENEDTVFDCIDSRKSIYDTFGKIGWESLEDFKAGKDKPLKDIFKAWIFRDPDTNEPIDEEDDDEETEKLKQEIRDTNAINSEK
jgi:hypothetical protein